MALAASSGVPLRPRGVSAASSAMVSGPRPATMSVSMTPGATQLTRMPEGPSSLARACVSAMTAPLVAE